MEFAAAYGSAVFPQEKKSGAFSITKTNSDKMVDFIFAVEDPVDWHFKNIEDKSNGHHYSGIPKLGRTALGYVQDFGCGIYYNTLLDVNTSTGPLKIKYGVIATNRLLDDLTNWSDLYVAGRMHKPMMILNTCEDINRASELNLYKAALVGILLLQPSFTERQLYTRIASLSYSGTFPIVSLQKGDVRMGFGEDPRKVQNIVNNNYNGFKLLYRNVLKQLLGEDIITQFEDGFARTKDKEKVSHVLSHLPLHIRELMIKKLDGTFEAPASWTLFVSPDVYQKPLKGAIRSTVWKGSFFTTLKGLFTAGVFKSGRYIWSKVAKANSWLQIGKK